MDADCPHLSCVHFTNTPVGMCLMRTAVSTLFTFCPPLPPERVNEISKSSSGTSALTASDNTGMSSTPAKLVCRAALALKGDRRTRRCVPFSDSR